MTNANCEMRNAVFIDQEVEGRLLPGMVLGEPASECDIGNTG